MAQASRDENRVTTALFESSTVPGRTVQGQIIEATGRIKVDNGGGGGSLTVTDGVTTVSNVSEINFTSGATVTDAGGGEADVSITGGGGGTVDTVVGTANRITVDSTDPANPIVDIAATYVGQTSITTLGTITTGVWTGTTIAIANGGTGQTSASAAFNALSPMTTGGDLIYGGTSGTGTRLANGSAGQVLTSQGTTVAPHWTTLTTAGLTVGTSTITSGTNTRILYDNSGVLGEYTLTGTGTVVAMQTSPTFVTDATTPVIKLSGTSNQAVFQSGGVTGTLTWTPTSTNKTITFPDATGTVALTTGGAFALVVGTTTISSGTSTRILYDNAGVLGEYTLTGSGTVAVMQNTPTLTTPVLGVATATSINKVTITAPATSSTLTVTDGKTLTVNDSTTLGTNGASFANGGAVTFASSKTLAVNNIMTLAAGADSQTFTFPSTSATVAGLGTTQTFTGQDKFNNIIDVNNAVTVTSNAGTVPVTFRLNTFTNSSAATMAITMATASAVDGQMTIVRIYDFSGVAETIGWTNTENSTVSVPTTSNGSTTLPLTCGFMFNGATSKWRIIAVA